MDASAIVAALQAKIGFEPLQVSDDKGHLRILGRIPRQSQPEMKPLIRTLLRASHGNWAADISVSFFLSPPTREGEPVQAWRFIFEAPGGLPYEAIAKAITTAPGSSQSMILGGVRLNVRDPDRNNPFRNNGKGAQLAGRAVVGPAYRRS